jgi:hypothetical protein
LSQEFVRRFIVFGIAVGLAIASPRPVHAFAPQAAGAIAALAPRALPPAAHWEPTWNEALTAEVERRIQAEDQGPEAAASAHRFDSSRTPIDPRSGESGAAIVIGSAPFELRDAANELRQAFVAEQSARIVQAIARVAISAADLSDPFLMSTPLRLEVEGARAKFCDAFGDPDLVDLAPRADGLPFDPVASGAALAGMSAAWRDSIERLVLQGDDLRLAALRRDRLSIALAIARAAVLASWTAAGSPSLESATPRTGEARLLPNPVQTSARIAFTLRSASPARIELYDVSGRRVWASELGRRPAGPQEYAFSSADLGSLREGYYVARVIAGDSRASTRMILIRN